MKHYDYIIIGSGIAGLYTALQASRHGTVLIITKGSIEECNTKYAQGGIAAAIGGNDSPELHFQDTIAAGAGLCDEEAVRILVTEAPDRIIELVNFGVLFDTQEGEIALTREAAHSVPRVLHAGGDSTGRYIELTLSDQVRSGKIPVREFSLGIDILVESGGVKGLRVLDCQTGALEDLSCRFLVLATGGAGQLFKFNTNPAVATGDGIALAFAAGAEIADMEFFQFHPTALRLPGVAPFLISEAVRGEGGILRNLNGRAFMADYAPERDLAPRDVVARSIVHEMEKTGAGSVFLDVTHLPRRTVLTRFPNIYHVCLEHGIDITSELIPVAPAAHYMIGGVKTDHWGGTNIAGLFAGGETACTGVHGANRLASNSLLEALVFSRRIVDRTTGAEYSLAPGAEGELLHARLSERRAPDSLPTPSLSALQELLWENVGIIRDGRGLSGTADVLAAWEKTLPPATDRPSHELCSLILVGRLMAEAALLREESRGAHSRTDFPQTSHEWQKHIVFTK
ncbi:MAG: L-aspartate oxidase [Chloroflexi bacterium RBG_16_57_8]|nr:MAG: L-aspartate oxidase [Chloroflexi bacterium RBG_16_57_8]